MNLPEGVADAALGTPDVVNEPDARTQEQKFEEFLTNAAKNSAEVAENWVTLKSRVQYDPALRSALMMILSSQPGQR